jgi:hypothetical protein
MAKISARGATKVADIRTILDGYPNVCRWVLCSDGRVLRQTIYGGNERGTLTVFGKLKSGTALTEATLIRIAKRRGFEVVA